MGSLIRYEVFMFAPINRIIEASKLYLKTNIQQFEDILACVTHIASILDFFSIKKDYE